MTNAHTVRNTGEIKMSEKTDELIADTQEKIVRPSQEIHEMLVYLYATFGPHFAFSVTPHNATEFYYQISVFADVGNDKAMHLNVKDIHTNGLPNPLQWAKDAAEAIDIEINRLIKESTQ